MICFEISGKISSNISSVVCGVGYSFEPDTRLEFARFVEIEPELKGILERVPDYIKLLSFFFNLISFSSPSTHPRHRLSLPGAEMSI